MPAGLPASLLLATRSTDGFFTLATALEHGVSKRMLGHLVGQDAVARVHRALYRVAGHRWSCASKQRAAVMAAPPTAAASYHGAAGWLEFPGFSSWLPEITCVGFAPKLRGVTVHRVAELSERDVTTQRGVRCTTTSRTLIDLSRLIGRERTIATTDEVLCAGMTSRHGLFQRASALLEGRPWVQPLVDITAPGADGVFWSALERRFGEGVGRAGLPRPEFNARLEHAGRTLYADALWCQQRLVVELHGLAFHARPAERGRDDERLNAFADLGLRVLVFGWRQVSGDFPAVASRVRRALDAAAHGCGASPHTSSTSVSFGGT